jgi:hypothetical protein
MKALNLIKWIVKSIITRRAFACLIIFGLFPSLLLASIPTPPGGGDEPAPPLDSWTFSDTNYWTSVLGFAPVSFTNLSVSTLGDGTAVVIDSTNAAWLQYNVTETDGTNNLRVDNGTVMFWFAPSWAGTNEGGTGPGQWGRLIDVGSYTTNASYGWWSLYIDPTGTNIFFGAQTNDGSGATYLSAPISWTTNRWHLLALTYSATNSTLYIDGAVVTNGPGVTYQPGPTALANGFYIGSESNGVSQAHGMFDDFSTYNYQVDPGTIGSTYALYSIFYLLNPGNAANITSAPSEPSSGSGSPGSPDYYDAITGQGSLQLVGSASTCVTSSNVWITNVVATMATNGTMNVSFTIEGGSNSVPYDVFANSVLGFGTNYTWAWMGQGFHCEIYTLTNLPPTSAFLILGMPQDTDGDGLTDAYENLVSHTNPLVADTDGDGISDSWEILLGLNPLVNDNAQPSSRSTYSYSFTDWLQGISGIRTGSVSLDNEGNILSVSQ